MNTHIEYYFSSWVRVKNAKPEDTICVEICNNLRQLILHDKFDGLFFHVPNEHNSQPTRAYSNLKKATGVIKGVSDYIFMRNGKNLAIEIKAGDNDQGEAQKHFEAWCEEHGVPYYVCKSWGDVKYILLKEGFIRND